MLRACGTAHYCTSNLVRTQPLYRVSSHRTRAARAAWCGPSCNRYLCSTFCPLNRRRQHNTYEKLYDNTECARRCSSSTGFSRLEVVTVTRIRHLRPALICLAGCWPFHVLECPTSQLSNCQLSQDQSAHNDHTAVNARRPCTRQQYIGAHLLKESRNCGEGKPYVCIPDTTRPSSFCNGPPCSCDAMRPYAAYLLQLSRGPCL